MRLGNGVREGRWLNGTQVDEPALGFGDGFLRHNQHVPILKTVLASGRQDQAGQVRSRLDFRQSTQAKEEKVRTGIEGCGQLPRLHRHRSNLG